MLCRCKCISDGRAGINCDTIIEQVCITQCSGHGECQGGWCKCFEGYYGHDCAQRRLNAAKLESTSAWYLVYLVYLVHTVLSLQECSLCILQTIVTVSRCLKTWNTFLFTIFHIICCPVSKIFRPIHTHTQSLEDAYIRRSRVFFWSSRGCCLRRQDSLVCYITAIKTTLFSFSCIC